MNKSQLIAEAARRGNITQREVRESLDAIIEVMADAFEHDINIAVAGLGTFRVKKRCNVKKYLPEDGRGPVKGVTGGRVMKTISDRRYIQFNPAPCINLEYFPDTTSHTKVIEQETDRSLEGT